MFSLKQGFKNVIRMPGRSILVGIIMAVISMSVLVSISIENGAKSSIVEARKRLGNEVRLQPNFQQTQKNPTKGNNGQILIKTEEITEAIASKLLSSKYVESYDYIVSGFASSSLKEVSTSGNNTGVQFQINTANGFEMPKFRLMGNSNPQLQSDFKDGDKKIIEGNFYTEEQVKSKEKVVVIDKVLADLNNLKIGDNFPIKANGTNNIIDLKIIGIYEDTLQSDTKVPMSMMIRSNTLYVPYTVVRDISNEDKLNDTNRPKDFLSSVSYYLNDPLNVDKFKSEAKELGLDLEKYALDANDTAYLKMVGPMEKLSSFSNIALIIIVISGAVIMALLMGIITRERKQEVGILRSLGVKRSKIVRIFLTETMIVTTLALSIGAFGGTVLSGKTADYLLQREVLAQKEAESLTGKIIIIGQDINKASENNTIEKVDINISPQEILMLIIITIFIATLGSASSAYLIMKYEPMNILNNRS